MERRIGPTTSRWSRIVSTPSSPTTALVMPWYSSGSSSVIQIDSAMSSSVAAGLLPSNFSGPSSSLTFAKASALDSRR